MFEVADMFEVAMFKAAMTRAKVFAEECAEEERIYFQEVEEEEDEEESG